MAQGYVTGDNLRRISGQAYTMESGNPKRIQGQTYAKGRLKKSDSWDYESGLIDDYFDSYDATYSLSTLQAYSGSYSLYANGSGYPSNTFHFAKKSFATLDQEARINKIQFYWYYNGGSTNDDIYFGLLTDPTLFFGRILICLRRDSTQSGARDMFIGFANFNTNVTLPTEKWIRVTFDNIDHDDQTYDIEVYNETDSVSLYSASTPYVLDFTGVTGYQMMTQPINPVNCFYDGVSVEYDIKTFKRVRHIIF